LDLPRSDEGQRAAHLRAVQDGLGPGAELRRRARRQDPPARCLPAGVPQGRARGQEGRSRGQAVVRRRHEPGAGGGGSRQMQFRGYLGLAPLLIVTLGGLLLMVAEAFSHRREESDVRESGPSSDLAIGTAITLFAGAVMAVGVW